MVNSSYIYTVNRNADLCCCSLLVSLIPTEDNQFSSPIVSKVNLNYDNLEPNLCTVYCTLHFHVQSLGNIETIFIMIKLCWHISQNISEQNPFSWKRMCGNYYKE